MTFNSQLDLREVIIGTNRVHSTTTKVGFADDDLAGTRSACVGTGITNLLFNMYETRDGNQGAIWKDERDGE